MCESKSRKSTTIGGNTIARCTSRHSRAIRGSRLAAICVLVFSQALGGCNETPAQADQGEEYASQEHEQTEGHDDHDDHDDHDKPESPETPETVELDAQALESANITLEAVEQGSLRDDIEATAVVKYDVDRVAHITPLVDGQIAEMRATLGDKVEKGQTLAIMRSVELGDARAALHQARSALQVARQHHERQKKLAEKGIASERSAVEAHGAFKQAEARMEAAHSRLRTLGVSGGRGPEYPLESHIEGIIIEQHASLGETKSPKDALFVVADHSVVWVIGRIPEKDAHAVRPEMSARITLDAYPGRTWEGSVDWIASTLDAETRLLPIRVELPNPEGLLKPGMFGAVRLSTTDSARKVPLVPVDAVQRIDGRQVVFVAGDHDGEFQAQPVELGAEAAGRAEVLDGLAADATIVTRGAFNLKAALTAVGRSADHHH